MPSVCVVGMSNAAVRTGTTPTTRPIMNMTERIVAAIFLFMFFSPPNGCFAEKPMLHFCGILFENEDKKAHNGNKPLCAL